MHLSIDYTMRKHLPSCTIIRTIIYQEMHQDLAVWVPMRPRSVLDSRADLSLLLEASAVEARPLEASAVEARSPVIAGDRPQVKMPHPTPAAGRIQWARPWAGPEEQRLRQPRYASRQGGLLPTEEEEGGRIGRYEKSSFSRRPENESNE